MAAPEGANQIARRVIDDLIEFSRETSVDGYMSFFKSQQITENRGFINQMCEEANMVRNLVGQLNALIVEMKALEDRGKLFDTLMDLSDDRESGLMVEVCHGNGGAALCLLDNKARKLVHSRPSTSKYASTHLSRRSTGPTHLRRAKKGTQKAAFTSAGRAPYTFRINGQNYHRMGSLLPKEGMPPKFAQLYFLTLIMRSEIEHLLSLTRKQRNTHSSQDFRLRLHSERKTTRQYNASTVSEVAAIIINDFGDAHPTRDIVVDRKDTGPQRVSKLHPLYMVLQYPLLFSYGDDGFHEKIPYHANKGTRKTKRGYVTMQEYYSYIIHQRPRQGSPLLKGGCLFQQYLVDAYTVVEEQRLKWTKNNQDTLRINLYHNMCDAVTRGDTSAVGFGKRIVLPRTFTGSPMYMMQNYQDAMVLCRAYGNPDLFITFTSNPKWPEISEV
nr:hypothetical protein CTI12_AA123990 [Tanacetum cinerariifolium]